MGDGTPTCGKLFPLKKLGASFCEEYPVAWLGNETDCPLTLCLIDCISWTSSSNLLFLYLIIVQRRIEIGMDKICT